MNDPLLDVRPAEVFSAAHLPGAANIPLQELLARIHELPARATPLRIFDSDLTRAQRAADLLRDRGHEVLIHRAVQQSLTETGPSRRRLWQPNPFLLESLKQSPPSPGTPGFPCTHGRWKGRGEGSRALDIACGSGRDAVYLAMHGYQVDAIDVLPDALARASDLARRNSVSINTIPKDLERDPLLPRDRYQLIVVFRYLQRTLFPALRDAVAPGGFIAYETFHEKTLETGKRPKNPEHLLKTGELVQAFNGFEILIANDAIERDGRFVSNVLARRNGPRMDMNLHE